MISKVMTLLTEQIKNELAGINPEMLFADGFDDAYIGYAVQFNSALAVYDHEKCIQVLVLRDGMTPEEAEEFMSYSVTGAWVGENTPLFFYGGV